MVGCSSLDARMATLMRFIGQTINGMFLTVEGGDRLVPLQAEFRSGRSCAQPEIPLRGVLIPLAEAEIRSRCWCSDFH